MELKASGSDNVVICRHHSRALQLQFSVCMEARGPGSHFYRSCMYMSFTRGHDDTARIRCALAATASAYDYMTDVPGTGHTPPYVNDPHIRMQKWGANLRSGCSDIESGLRTLGLPLTRDCTNNLKSFAQGLPLSYESSGQWTDETRATHPAWKYRGLDGCRSDYLFVDPQRNAEASRWVSTSSRDEARQAFEGRSLCGSPVRTPQ